jgi:hypothetical protein
MLSNSAKNLLKFRYSGSGRPIMLNERKYAVKSAYLSDKNTAVLEQIRNDPKTSPQEKANAINQLKNIASLEAESGASVGKPHKIVYHTAKDHFDPEQQAEPLGSITHHAPSHKNSFNCTGQLGKPGDNQEAVVFKEKNNVSEKTFGRFTLEAESGSLKEKEILDRFSKKD